jgi:predicted nucleic acid-binding protein
MPKAVVVDASVIVKWFVEEEGSQRALEIRNKYIDGEIKLIAPEIIIFEVLNALSYKKLFSVDEIKEIAEALDAFSFELYSLMGEYAKKTVEVSCENNITIYDASYISLATMKRTCMYTADVKLKEKLKDKYLDYIELLE